MTNSVMEIGLSVTLLDYWHAGAGTEAAYDLDAVVDKDADGLPRIRGRMLKGLLRDAIYRAEKLGILTAFVNSTGPDIAARLFGSDGFGTDNVVREDTRPGVLRLDDARLPATEREVLSQDRHSGLRRWLYREVFSTAIDHATDAAQSRTLRGIEVTVPVELETTIHWIEGPGSTHSPLAREWPAIIERCLPLVRSVGAHRSRGLGRAVFTVRLFKAAAEAPRGEAA